MFMWIFYFSLLQILTLSFYGLYRELLEENRVKLTSTWKEVKKRIKDDPRYMKFSSSERVSIDGFESYIIKCTLIWREKNLTWNER